MVCYLTSVSRWALDKSGVGLGLGLGLPSEATCLPQAAAMGPVRGSIVKKAVATMAGEVLARGGRECCRSRGRRGREKHACISRDGHVERRALEKGKRS